MKNRFFVGVYKDQTILVYDEEMQLKDGPNLAFWDVKNSEMVKYVSAATSQIEPITDSTVISNIIKAYQEWRTRSGEVWLKDEIRHYKNRAREEERKKTALLEEEEARRRAEVWLQERHKQRLSRLGIAYHGVRQASGNSSPTRVTHCYVCRKPLNSSVDIECVSCGWIICQCSACGCGYHGSSW